MKTIKNILVLVLYFISFVSFSQSSNSRIIESGYLINKPLKGGDHFVSDGTTNYSFDLTYKYFSSLGSYFKYGMEKKLYSNGNWSAFLPLGLSYLKQSYKYYIKGYSYGCFTSSVYDGMVESYNQYLSAYVGVGLSYHSNYVLFSASTNLNKIYSIPNSNKSISRNLIPYLPNLPMYLSSQLTSLFQIRKSLFFGPSCEFYCLGVGSFSNELNSLFSGRNTNRKLGLYANNFYIKSVWINPGIKMQFSF